MHFETKSLHQIPGDVDAYQYYVEGFGEHEQCS